MSLADFIKNRLLQYAYISQTGQYIFQLDAYAGNKYSTYRLSAFTFQDSAITIQLGQTGYSTSSVAYTPTVKLSVATQVSYKSVQFVIDTFSTFTHPTSIAITIKPGNVYPM